MTFFFFFFQAEDGIRDYKVTGVQTCALPISRRRGPYTGRGAEHGWAVRRKDPRDRKSTRLNSSHLVNSNAVFFLKKKKNILIIYKLIIIHMCSYLVYAYVAKNVKDQ